LNSLAVARFAGLIVLGLFLVLRIGEPEILRDIRFQVFDYYQQIKPRVPVAQPITIVDIDERSLRKIGQWPWPRNKLAELISKLTQQGVVTIAFDMIFAEEDSRSPSAIARNNPDLPEAVTQALLALPSNETVMAEAIRNSRVVLGQTSVREAKDNAGEEREVLDAPHAKIGEDPIPFLRQTQQPNLVENLAELEVEAAGRGVFSFIPDSDGIVRRVPLVMLVNDRIRPALSLETLRIATGGDSFAIRTSVAGIEGVIVARKLVATDNHARVWNYFRQPSSDRYVSAAAIFDGSVDTSRIANHIVLIGTSTVGLEDYRPIPLGVTVPGVEVHAQVLENILTGSLLTRSPRALLYEVALATLAALLLIFLAFKLRATYAIAIALVLTGLAGAFSWWSFSANLQLIDVTWPIMTILAVSVTGGIANYIREERQRQQVQSAFGQYLSPTLVDQLSENPDQLVLGGETRDLSILFTDVRGFTTLSESYRDDPEGLTKLMNHFLTKLSQPILDHDGTIDKYMGDAIMAFWNAPIDQPHHRLQACKAALDMIAAVASMNEVRREEFNENSEEAPPINVGIGINSGTCVVGNMGSDKRFDYTALGDTVNLASRLEGQSKPYGLPIVIGDATAEQVRDQLATFEIDLIRVKGKTEPVRIHCLAGDERFAAREEFAAFRALNKTMLAAYHNREWDTAFDALEKMEELGEKLAIPIEDYVFIYETRISEFRVNPPGRDWDGVYTATSK